MYFTQNIDNAPALAGKTITLSVLAGASDVDSGSYFTANLYVNDVWKNYVTIIGNSLRSVTYTIPSDATRIYVTIAQADGADPHSIELRAIKLEVGNIQTLAHQDNSGNWVLNEIPDYQTELFRCQTSTAWANDTYANRANVTDSWYSKPNLLDNWDFSNINNIVNQRGVTSVSDGSYGIDRWFGSYSIDASGMTFGDNKQYAIQKFTAQNMQNWDGKQATASILYSDGTLTTGTKIYRASSDAYNFIGGVGIQFNKRTDGSVLLYCQAPASIKAVKLELGTQQTLAHKENDVWVLNETPNYQEELFKCQTSTADSSDIYANKTNIVDNYYSHPNLLDNWDFSNADNIVDQWGGKVVPTGTAWWTSADSVPSSGTSGSGGTAQAYRQITVTGTNSGGVAYVGWVVSGTTYYTRAAYAVRGYVANSTYLIDRWQAASGAIVRILPNGIGITGAGKNVQQTLGVEASTPLIGKTITFSALVDGDFIYKTSIVPQIPTSSTQWFASVSSANFGVILGIGTTGRLYYVFRNGSTHMGESIVHAVKLEEGTISTLCHNEGTAETPVWVLNKHQNYGDALAECQRYQWKRQGSTYQTIGNAMAQSATEAYCMVTMPVPLRVRPSLIRSGNLVLLDGTNTIPVASCNINSSSTPATDVTDVSLAIVAYGLTVGKWYKLQFREQPYAYLLFDANL